MNATTLLALFYAVLLGLEWRYRLKSLRLGTASLALAVLFFAQPSSTQAARWAIGAGPAERITQLGSQLSEYESGVATMKLAVEEDAKMGAAARLLGVVVLFWLACSPVIRRTRLVAGGERLPVVHPGERPLREMP
jgi:hypothetical protein